MKIATRRVYVVECPRCRKPIDFSGEGGSLWFTMDGLIKNVEAYRSCEPRMTLTEWCGCKDRDRRKTKEKSRREKKPA